MRGQMEWQSMNFDQICAMRYGPMNCNVIGSKSRDHNLVTIVIEGKREPGMKIKRKMMLNRPNKDNKKP